MDRGIVYSAENTLVLIGIIAALTFAVSTVKAFWSDEAEAWRVAKWSLQVGVLCAVVMVVLNIVLRG